MLPKKKGGHPGKGSKEFELTLPECFSITKGGVIWTRSTADEPNRERQAVAYVKVIRDSPTLHIEPGLLPGLARIICNLRKYHTQSRESTIRIILDHFNPYSDWIWTAEEIGLIWDLVGSYTPSLGISDKDAVAKRAAAELYEEVVDLVLELLPNGQVSMVDLYRYFQATHPNLQVTKNAFGRAFYAVTGIRSSKVGSVRYYKGFRLPSPLQEAA